MQEMSSEDLARLGRELGDFSKEMDNIANKILRTVKGVGPISYTPSDKEHKIKAAQKRHAKKKANRRNR